MCLYHISEGYFSVNDKSPRIDFIVSLKLLTLICTEALVASLQTL